MTWLSDEETIRLLREAVPPLEETSPEADLWPSVRGQVQAGSPAPTIADWILMAIVAALCLLQPSAALVPLFHF